MTNILLKRSPIPSTDIEVPCVTVGTGGFGKRSCENESIKIAHAAIDRGLIFFDTADSYGNGNGESERLLGKALKGKRKLCIIGTKKGLGPRMNGKFEGLTRTAILQSIDKSLTNLDTDYVDIYYFHRPDPFTPIEESLTAIDEVIRAGKARYFGISKHSAWQSLEVIQFCQANGLNKPVITQLVYNPLIRQIELEYVAFAKRYNLYLTGYNPLAGGFLTGKYENIQDARKRAKRFVGNERYHKRYLSKKFGEIMLGLKKIANIENLSLTHMTLLWILQEQKVDNIIIGPRNTEQLFDCLAAGEFSLSDAGIKQINSFLLEFDGTNTRYGLSPEDLGEL